MKRYLTLAVFLFCILGISSQEKEKVVIESSYGDSIPQNIRNIFMHALSSGLTNSGRFEVLTNREEYIKKLSGELQIQHSGYIDENQMLKIGKASGADHVIYARIETFEGDFFITFQMTELETGKSIRAPEPIVTTRSELLATARKLALDLASGSIGAGENKTSSPIGIVCANCIDSEGVYINGYIDEKDNSPATWSDAVATCSKKGDGWRLPTINELKIIYKNQRKILDAGSRSFQFSAYWSMSLRNNFSAYGIDFDNGSQTYISKSSQSAFRCVYAAD
ncbi:DUF1566 domain-containing protein [Bacteroides sp. OttesenSCG-928-D19]|nr:DUF1566 domain-containing protein [Bacteroides sp. OttesenSCG-928-D19]